MKRVVTNAMVAHLWAHQAQSEARSANGSFYFEGDTIYSYGSHFPIARHFKDVILFTERSHSITTSQHKGLARSAVFHKTVIYVTDMGNDKSAIPENFKYFTDEIDRYMGLSIRARLACSHNYHLESAQKVCDNANLYAKLVKRKRTFSLPNPEKVKEAIKETRKLEKKKHAELILHNFDRMKAWENGELINFPWHSSGGLPVCLRLKSPNKLCEVVETSQGAEFPLSHGKRIYEFAKKCRDTKTSFQHNGHRVPIGVFQVDSVSTHGDVKAGCHDVKWETIERFAKRMEW